MSLTMYTRAQLHVIEELNFQNLRAPGKYHHHRRRRRRRRRNNNNNNNN
jgi:hypothetical protein